MRPTVRAIQAWHAEHQPGALVLLPLDPGPVTHADEQRFEDHLQAEGPAVGWVRAALAGSEVLDDTGRVLRRASGAIFLSGVGAPFGPIRRRAELATLNQEVETAEGALQGAEAALQATVERLVELEDTLSNATQAAEQARDAERLAHRVTGRLDPSRRQSRARGSRSRNPAGAHHRAAGRLRAAHGRDR